MKHCYNRQQVARAYANRQSIFKEHLYMFVRETPITQREIKEKRERDRLALIEFNKAAEDDGYPASWEELTGGLK